LVRPFTDERDLAMKNNLIYTCVLANERGRKLLSMCSEYDSNLIVVKLISVFFLSYSIA